MLGFLYPAYMSMRALRTSTTADDTKWLVYWMVFALISVVDNVDVTLRDYIKIGIPFYYAAKLVVIFVLLGGGAGAVSRLIMPIYHKYAGNLDAVDHVFLAAIKNPVFDKVDERVQKLSAKDLEWATGQLSAQIRAVVQPQGAQQARQQPPEERHQGLPGRGGGEEEDRLLRLTGAAICGAGAKARAMKTSVGWLNAVRHWRRGETGGRRSRPPAPSRPMTGTRRARRARAGLPS